MYLVSITTFRGSSHFRDRKYLTWPKYIAGKGCGSGLHVTQLTAIPHHRVHLGSS